MIREVEIVHREDLDLKNHLSGLQRKLLKVSFWNVQQQMEAKRELMPIIWSNRDKAKTKAARAVLANPVDEEGTSYTSIKDVMESIIDMREYDVPYHIRFAIDSDVRCGHWFTVKCLDGDTSLHRRADLLQRAKTCICAWKETPAYTDELTCSVEPRPASVYLITNKEVVGGEIKDFEYTPKPEYHRPFTIGYLITNKEVVGGEIKDFEYTPKPEFDGPFTIFNEDNELVKPAIYVTYNGDFFDMPFVDKRCQKYNLDIYEEMGFKMTATNGGGGTNSGGGEWLSRHAVHMDCLHWVNRDSYLPQGSRGLKSPPPGAPPPSNPQRTITQPDHNRAHSERILETKKRSPLVVTLSTLGDKACLFDHPKGLYIHPFIFSLATVIPMPPDEVLRKGSGTLCEQLLLVQAYQKSIVCPNKHHSATEVMYKGHLLESETYIGGKVEAIESGVFRSDLPLKFKLKPQGYQGLLDKLDRDIKYAIEVEAKMKLEDITNFDEVKAQIASELESLRDVPNREEVPLMYHMDVAAMEEAPLIYHLDVAAMYPNIILTNRLEEVPLIYHLDVTAMYPNIILINRLQPPSTVANPKFQPFPLRPCPCPVLLTAGRREEVPLIYHLDVAAMYPNIILTNRLQPSSIVTDEDCAACDFNKPGKDCLRTMDWKWRGEHYAGTRAEYMSLKNQLQSETFPPAEEGEPNRPPRLLLNIHIIQPSSNSPRSLLNNHVYKRILDKPVTEMREAGICQRENSFYVDTVRAFRDRRYEYKGAKKMWTGKLEAAKADNDPIRMAAAADMCVLYESLQLAHKCILNSFYGYVMRKGARWYSMEMAGVVTYTGAKIIQNACTLVEQLGRPLELDTDGIWCALPASFPENFKLNNKNGKVFKLEYPCIMLNVMCADHFTNEQYQDLIDPVNKKYAVSSQMSIEFEVDGPYKVGSPIVVN
eukprot:gene17971-24376_t